MASNKRLSQICDTMATLLDSGVPVSRALRVAGEQHSPARLGRAMLRVRDRVESGTPLGEALRSQDCFPALFINLVEAGESSGKTDRVFAELSSYYEFQSQLWRTFLGSLVFPVLEYIAAVFVLALVQYIVGMFSADGGALGRAIWTVLLGYGIPVGLVGLYFVTTRLLRGSHAAHAVLLKIPLLEKVVRALALARFSLVMHMMLEAGTPVENCLEKACQATGNGVFQARSRLAREAVRTGASLAEALDRTGLFPTQYLEILSVAEESGQMSERFEWLAREHQKQAKNYLSALMTALSWLIWALVAAFIIYFIFRMAAGYVGKINELTGGR